MLEQPAVTLDYSTDPDWLIVHSTYAAKNDITSYPGWRRWDPVRRKWVLFPVDGPTFKDHMKLRGFIVHDQRAEDDPFEGLIG